jgi:hypothetical protein
MALDLKARGLKSYAASSDLIPNLEHLQNLYV